MTLWEIDIAPSGGALLDFGAGGNTVAVAFRGPTGALTADNAGSVLLWDTDPNSISARPCAIVGRNLTREEWSEVLPERPYEETCPTNGRQ